MVQVKKRLAPITHGLAKVKGFGFILWHARHEMYHALLGIAWAWTLREIWGEFQIKWLFLAIFGSLLPDIEHFIYFLSYGKTHEYTRTIKQYIRNGQWRMVTVFIENGHKKNTDLSYHNFYVIAILLIVTTVAFLFDWQSWVVMFGAMVTHYVFDVIDDVLMLGKINPNWKRWGNGKKKH